MSLKFSLSLRNARAQANIDMIDAGVNAGVMNFYTGPQPESGAAITTETLLADLELSDPSGTVDEGVLIFSPVSDELSAQADGDIAWCRITDSDGNYVMDLDCGITGSGAAIIFNSLSVLLGGTVKILSGSITEGNL